MKPASTAKQIHLFIILNLLELDENWKLFGSALSSMYLIVGKLSVSQFLKHYCQLYS